MMWAGAVKGGVHPSITGGPEPARCCRRTKMSDQNQKTPKKNASFTEQVNRFSPNFWVCNLIEAFERLAFFGVAAVRSLYMKNALKMSDGGAGRHPRHLGADPVPGADGLGRLRRLLRLPRQHDARLRDQHRRLQPDGKREQRLADARRGLPRRPRHGDLQAAGAGLGGQVAQRGELGARLRHLLLGGQHRRRAGADGRR
jgi:hypothetical protein